MVCRVVCVVCWCCLLLCLLFGATAIVCLCVLFVFVSVVCGGSCVGGFVCMWLWLLWLCVLSPFCVFIVDCCVGPPACGPVGVACLLVVVVLVVFELVVAVCVCVCALCCVLCLWY